MQAKDREFKLNSLRIQGSWSVVNSKGKKDPKNAFAAGVSTSNDFEGLDQENATENPSMDTAEATANSKSKRSGPEADVDADDVDFEDADDGVAEKRPKRASTVGVNYKV